MKIKKPKIKKIPSQLPLEEEINTEGIKAIKRKFIFFVFENKFIRYKNHGIKAKTKISGFIVNLSDNIGGKIFNK